MEVSFEEKVASRGFHVYGKEVWKSPNTGQKLSAEKEKDPFALKTDLYSVAWKLKTKDKLIPVVVGDIPREIPRFVSFFMDCDGRMESCFVTGVQGISNTQGWFGDNSQDKIHHSWRKK